MRKDKTGRNSLLKLRYFDGFTILYHTKKYPEMNIHEKIIMRTAHCGIMWPSSCIMEMIELNY